MSAFQVDPAHIGAMLRSAIALGRLDRQPFAYTHQNMRIVLEEHLETVGQLLWDENARSMRTRYSDGDDVPTLPEGWSWAAATRRGRTPTAVETLKITACYRYQACETGDFETTEAGAFFDALREAAIRHLPGYDAAPWEWRS